MNEQYFLERRGIVINVDTKGVTSDCNYVRFHSYGDWDVIITIKGTTLKYKLGEGQSISFGTDRPNVTEQTMFDITFDPAGSGTKALNVERAFMFPIVNNNNSVKPC